MSDTPPGAPPADPGQPEGEPDEKKPDPAPEPEDPQAKYQRERRLRIAAEKSAKDNERKLSELQSATASDSEKAISQAKIEGRSEALREAGAKLAAAEFRAQATGKIGDPAAALELIDMRRFVDEEGNPDDAAIAEAVERLAAAAAVPGKKPTPPKVPNGIQPDATEGGDWLRSAVGH